MKSACFVSFTFQSQSFVKLIENFARTCVSVSVPFRNIVDGVGPVDNRPSKNKLCQFVKKKTKKNI